MIISSNFCGGNIAIKRHVNETTVELQIKPDSQSHFFQWFYFKAEANIGDDLRFHIINAKEASYPKGWDDYRARVSNDGNNWFTVPTTYQNGVLTIQHVATHAQTWVAYFAPYSMTRHNALIDKCRQNGVQHTVLGQSINGANMDKLTIGNGRIPIWIIARQHPGETMAEWWMQGFLEKLSESNDPDVETICRLSTLHIVPNMNPDGSTMGHLRTNAVGANLNREWDKPSPNRSPEVYWVQKEMFKTGVSMCLDVHGDEGLPYNFLDGPLGIQSITPELIQNYNGFVTSYLSASDEMQDEHGYDAVPQGKADMSICTNWIADTFKCVSATLEQPFKDNANSPHPETGWSPLRCKQLGRAGVKALLTAIESGYIKEAVE